MIADTYDLPRPDLAALSELHSSVNHNETLGDHKLRDTAGFGQSHHLQKIVKFDIFIGSQPKFFYLH